MLTTIKQRVEVQDGGLLQLHVEVKPHTMVTVVIVMEFPDNSATAPSNNIDSVKIAKGLLNGRFKEPVELQQKLRDEWEDRENRETFR